MVFKHENPSSTLDVVNYLKRPSSFEECDTTCEVEVRNIKETREEENTNTTIETPTKNNRNAKLTVTFSSKNDVFEITSPTKEEKNDMHMSREDQRLIIREISNAIRRSDRSELQQLQCIHDDDVERKRIEDLCLERILEQQDSERTERVKSAICIILQRQRQSKLFHSPEKQLQINEVWLEKHYRPFSKISAHLARSRGIRDQEMAPYLSPRKIVMSR